MKKILFFAAAASALLLTACSSENDLVQTGPQKTIEKQAVGFEVYTPAATNATRSGYQGTLTTSRLQNANAGFGVYTFYSDQKTAADYTGNKGYADLNAKAGLAADVLYIPNFMVNEKILWNSTNQGWEYAPLKYWPNETENDSQINPDPAIMETSTLTSLDRLTFFSYAPYVTSPTGKGVTAVTANNGKITPTVGTLTAILTDPSVEYKAGFATGDGTFANTNPNTGVDLLWGVAPSGGLNYTAVNGTTVSKAEGLPLIDMTKPDVNTSMKFLFEHALARFGVKVAASVDQLTQGGTLDPNTKITVNSVKLTGYFGDSGILNLNNDKKNAAGEEAIGAHVANWTRWNTVDLAADLDPATILVPGNKRTIVITKTDATHTNIAPHLQYQGTYDATPDAQNVVGVTTTLQDLITPSDQFYNRLFAVPTYDPGKVYYTDESGTKATAKVANGTKAQINGKWGFFYTKSSEVYTKQAADVVAPTYPEHVYGSASTLYFVTATEHTVTVADTKPSTIGDGVKVYTISGSGTFAAADEADAPTYVENATYSGGTWTGAAVDDKVYTLDAVNLSNAETPYKYDPAGTYYEAERNFFMVVPTYNIWANLSSAKRSTWTEEQEQDLRTITVEIEYYITTEDSKLNAARAQTKNVVTKNVVLPHIKNGQSYNLNLILGLTSVKVEADVDDWKVTNVNGYLPQNTAGE